MKDGWIKVASAAPEMHLADCYFNGQKIAEAARTAAAQGVKLLITPELSLTGYTCGDLFFQKTLLDAAELALLQLRKDTKKLELLLAVGMPVRHLGKLFNCAVMLYKGEILGVVPKSNLCGYEEFYETRFFAPGTAEETVVRLPLAEIDGMEYVPFGAQQVFFCRENPEFAVGLEICEDLWVPMSPSVEMCRRGATIIGNLCASHDGIGKVQEHRLLVQSQSQKLHCGYLLSSAGEQESSGDLVFSAQQLICENGQVLAEKQPFETGLLITEIDVQRLTSQRRKINTYPGMENSLLQCGIGFSMAQTETRLTRHIPRDPYLPEDPQAQAEECHHIFLMQSHALARRLEHIHASAAVLGVSGGLDSTLALLVCHKAMELMHQSPERVAAVTMPCFGTTSRTRSNAELLCRELGIPMRCIPIGDAVTQHFADIGHDPENHNVTFENAQARERTQVLMDLSNELGGIVVGTGDFSELALGWATYNGDHMSMYGVNAGIPKTQIRQVVRWYAESCGNEALKAILMDILETPVSPELLPAKEGEITQKTESIVGPYELHDFFLYYLLRYGFTPEKIHRMACHAFAGEYDSEYIAFWLQNCIRRFMTQQYKRSCMPDGPMIGSLSLSPRGAWRMPSDCFGTIWNDAARSLSKKD